MFRVFPKSWLFRWSFSSLVLTLLFLKTEISFNKTPNRAHQLQNYLKTCQKLWHHMSPGIFYSNFLLLVFLRPSKCWKLLNIVNHADKTKYSICFSSSHKVPRNSPNLFFFFLTLIDVCFCCWEKNEMILICRKGKNILMSLVRSGSASG